MLTGFELLAAGWIFVVYSWIPGDFCSTRQWVDPHILGIKVEGVHVSLIVSSKGFGSC